MMDKLDYLEKQITQYQASNAFGSGMVKVIESQLTLNKWDREVLVDQKGQVPGSWQYWATLRFNFINSGGIIPPYMIMIDAEINGKDIYEFPWYGQVPHSYTGQMASCGTSPPVPIWIEELKVNDRNFLTISTLHFTSPPTAKYKLRIYAPYEVTIQILHENQRQVYL